VSQRPTISIIIVSYNTKDLLLNCLKSVFRNDRRLDLSGAPIKDDDEEKIPAEIIIVDNCSSDGSIEAVRKFQIPNPNFQTNPKSQFPNIRLIKNKENLGFAKANNQGIKIARGEYVLLLNSDTLVPEGSISQTLLWLSARPKVGVVSCRLMDRSKRTQPTGGFFPNLLNLFCWASFLDDLPCVNSIILPYHPPASNSWVSKNWYRNTRQLDWVTGAFLMTRKAVFREVGYLSEEFFMYVEELEWCYRVKKIGWEIWYYPDTKIFHFGGASGESGTAIFGEDRGLVKFYSIHRKRWQGLVLKPILKLKNILRYIVFGIIGGNEQKKRIFIKAFFSN